MKPPLPQLLSLSPRGVIVDEAGRYQGLAPWFETRLLREILRRYNEHPALEAFVQSWARMPAGSAAPGESARGEAALALAKAHSLSALVEVDEPPRDTPRPASPGRRRADRPGDDAGEPPPDPEPSGPKGIES